MPPEAQTIHHLVPASELSSGCAGGVYVPARLPQDGFVHCSEGSAVTLSVAASYFAGLAEDLWVLEIDVQKLQSELRFEAAAPIDGGGTGHLVGADLFPHVYGPIDRAAIRGAGLLERDGSHFRWPERFRPFDEVLGSLSAGGTIRA